MKYSNWTKEELIEELECQKQNRQLADDRSNFQFDLLLCHAGLANQLGMSGESYHAWLMDACKRIHEDEQRRQSNN